MPFFNAPDTLDALTANGDDTGYVTVASNEKYYPGAQAWLRSDTLGPKEYVVTDLVGPDKVGLREVLPRGNGPQYGRTPLTQWTTATNATIAQAGTTVAVEWSHIKRPLT